MDFGLSASTKDGDLSMRCGSPGYVAPEILNDMPYGCKVDIFSAGIILYILYVFELNKSKFYTYLDWQGNSFFLVEIIKRYWLKIGMV